MKKSAAVLLVFALLVSLVSCGNPYHATAADADVLFYENPDAPPTAEQDGKPVFSSTFLSDTAIKGWWNDSADRSASLPETKTVVIHSPAALDAAFSDCPFDLNFDSEMLVVYTLKMTTRRQTVVKKTDFSDGVFTIHLENKKAKWGAADTCTPYQRYVVIKTDKVDATDVRVVYTVR